MDLTDVLGSTVQDAGFDDHEFEELVGFLLREEIERRHRGTKVTGPVKKGKGDGGRDIQVTVQSPPKIPREDAGPSLTWDEPGTTWYSCKTTTRKRGWLAGVKADVGWKHWVKKSSPKNRRLTRPPVELLEALAGGARYVVVINEEAGTESKFLDQLAQVFEFWFEHHPALAAPMPTPAGLRQRLELVEVNHLAWVIRSHRPQLPAPTRDKLGAIEPKGLQSWESWSNELSPPGRREPPQFVPDAPRISILDALQGVGPNATKRVLRVFGAPGVGKTRTVHQGLARLGSAVTARVRYCNDIRRGQDIVESGWLPHAGALVLVLDEARTTDVPGVVSRFLADATSSARLVLVGTSDEYVRWEHDEMASLSLAQLDSTAASELIARELEAEYDPRIESILHLSEGYPLFAVYLARALLEDGDAIDRPRDGGVEEWLAAQRVLAGSKVHFNMDLGRWEREAEIRAKCLLVALLTWKHEVSWDDLWSEHHEALAAALDEPQDWEQVKRAERKCVKRELLRYSGGRARRYVSPRNLARILINHFFDGEGPDLGPKLRRHLPQFHSSLHTLAERLSVRPDIRDRLARGEWEGLYESVIQGHAESWPASWTLNDGLYHAARQVPEFAAACAKRVLDAVGDDSLGRAPGLREALFPGLQHLRHRKLSAAGFELVESALFRLARFDREPLINTPTGLWQSLFLPGLDHTHHPWPHRLALLRARLASPDPAARRLATMALGNAIDPRERAPSKYGKDDRIDAPWPGEGVPPAELVIRKSGLWSLLIDQCEDAAAVVAEAARAAVAAHFRGGIRGGLDAACLSRLRAAVNDWTPAQRQRLAEGIAEFRRNEAHLYGVDRSPFSELLTEIDTLTRALEPASFRERLLEHVGRWFPWHDSITDGGQEAYETTRDRELIAEALETPELLLDEIAWLTSDSAKRNSPFASRLGELDVGPRFLSAIESAARSTGNLAVLRRYVEGWSRRDELAVDRWLEAHVEDPLFAKAVAAVVPRLSPTQARLNLLRRALAFIDVEPAWLLHPLAQDHWLNAVPHAELLGLLDDMLARPALASAVVAVGVSLLGCSLDEGSRDRVLSALSRGAREWTSDRIVMVGQPTWRRAIMALWEAGRDDAVVDALLAALDIWSTHGANVALAEQVLGEVFASQGSAALWTRLVQPMLEREPNGLLAEQLAYAGLLRHVGADVLLEWVGSDVGRGIVATHMVTPHGPSLEELGCRLLVRFGGEGPVANELHARARSPGSARVGSYYEFERSQLENAEAWLRHPEPEVRRWAEAVAERLRGSLRQSEARAELRRHYG